MTDKTESEDSNSESQQVITRPEPVVYLVDDDLALCKALRELLKSAGHNPFCYNDAWTFFDDYQPGQPGCLLLDLKLPDIDGLELQELLSNLRSCLPIIFISGQADVSDCAQAMKMGAVDFLQKPVQSAVLLKRVNEALEIDRQERDVLSRTSTVEARLQQLTQREKEVLKKLAQGKLNKVIASELFISTRTVEVHRSHILHKMQASSIVQLVHDLQFLKESY